MLAALSPQGTKELSVLVVGAGVIGSVYGGQLALAGCRVWVFAYGDRERELAKRGIRLHDVATHAVLTAYVQLASTVDERAYDVVLVAVQAGQLSSTFPVLHRLKGEPHIIFFGNNPAGHAAIPSDLPGSYELAFPGIAGSAADGVVTYAQVTQQPTAMEAPAAKVSALLQAILESRGFPVQRTAHMDGWLAYHAVFISCILMALGRVGADAGKLGHDRQLLRLMCQAIEEGFAALRAKHIRGLPLDLAFLHLPLLRPVAVRYWSGVMRSNRGELYFAAHARSAPHEVGMLAAWILQQIEPKQTGVSHLRELLRPES